MTQETTEQQIDNTEASSEETNEKKLNPWLAIWTKPRATVQQLIDTNPEFMVIALACIGGISRALDRAATRGLGEKWDLPITLIMAFAMGAISGIIFLYIGSALIEWSGRKWLGGKGSTLQIRTAISWSYVPLLLCLVLWIPQIAMYGNSVFTLEGPAVDTMSELTIYLAIAFCEVTLGIWSLIILLKGIGQVQGFSAWKALGNILLPVLIIVIPIAIIIMFFVMLLK